MAATPDHRPLAEGEQAPVPAEIGEERLVERLEDAYGLKVVALEPMPGGADPDTTSFRVETDDGAVHFLKARRGPVDRVVASVALARFLADIGMPQILAPVPALTGRTAVRLGSVHLVLFPFVSGCDAFQTPLTESPWSDFGSVMKVVHSAAPPHELRWHLPVETFVPEAPKRVRHHLVEVTARLGGDSAAAALAAFLDGHRREVAQIVERTEKLADELSRRYPGSCLCHGAIHAGNLLLSDDGRLYLVGWDTPMLAPKERDLMFIGGGVGGIWNRPEEEAIFYRAYGALEVDAAALAYYRYGRIVEDIAITADALFMAGSGGSDRAMAVEHLLDQFGPGNTVEIAHHSYAKLSGERS